MTTRHLCLFALVFAGLSRAPVFAQATEQEQRIDAAWTLNFGRPPTADEAASVEKRGAGSVADLMARLRQELTGEAARTVVAKAGADVFGREPTASELAAIPDHSDYIQLAKRQLQWLSAHPADYEAVVRRAYHRVLDRDPYPDEMEYWRMRPVTSYVMLVGCVDNWALRNAPGLMETTGTPAISVNSRYLATVRLSPAVAAEVRTAAGLEAGDPALQIAAHRNILAPGADWILSVRGIPFVAVGRRTAIVVGE